MEALPSFKLRLMPTNLIPVGSVVQEDEPKSSLPKETNSRCGSNLDLQSSKTQKRKVVGSPLRRQNFSSPSRCPTMYEQHFNQLASEQPSKFARPASPLKKLAKSPRKAKVHQSSQAYKDLLDFVDRKKQ